MVGDLRSRLAGAYHNLREYLSREISTTRGKIYFVIDLLLILSIPATSYFALGEIKEHISSSNRPVKASPLERIER